MKIAFVSQPIDSVLPPYQNSVGACTYGSARAMPRDCEILVCGSQAANDGPALLQERNVQYEFFPVNLTDRLLYALRTRASNLVPIIPPISTSSLMYPEYGLKVAQRLSKERFDIIHIQHCSQFIRPIRKLNPGAKLVLHLHAEWFSQCQSSGLGSRLNGLNLLTTVSDYVTERTTRDFSHLRIPVVTHYNGVDPMEFSREKDYSALSQRRPYQIMFAGGISPHKGVHVLVDAFKLVAAELPEVRLTLIGPQGNYPINETFDRKDHATIENLVPFYGGNPRGFAKKLFTFQRRDTPSYVSQLKDRIPANLANQVVFTGKIAREELIEHYYNSHLFVFPSLFAEGFGLPPVEAMASGTAVVATRSGAMVETVSHGETGLLVEKNDPVALAQAMLTLLRDEGLRERLGRAGRRRAMELFTWAAVTEKMHESYQRLCAPGSDGGDGKLRKTGAPAFARSE